MIVLISIGNSDDKLSQRRWADFQRDLNEAISQAQNGEFLGAVEPLIRHGRWVSQQTDPWQNAAWCIEFPEGGRYLSHHRLIAYNALRADLAWLANHYEQDSIAWVEAPSTEFIGPSAIRESKGRL